MILFRVGGGGGSHERGTRVSACCGNSSQGIMPAAISHGIQSVWQTPRPESPAPLAELHVYATL